MAVIDESNLQDVFTELDEVAHKWKPIGLALGCPHSKLQQIEQTQTNYSTADCLRGMLDYRRKQLKPTRLTWKEIIKALRVKNVSEKVLANSIAEQYCPSEVKKPPSVIDESNLQDVLTELDEVAHKWKPIGLALGCPHSKLQQIEQTQTNYSTADCLRDMLDYRRKQLKPTRLTWKEIIKALRVKNVSEAVLANSIAEQYCPSEVVDPDWQSPSVNREGDSKPPKPGQTGKSKVSFTTCTVAVMGCGCVVAVVLGIILYPPLSESPTHDSSPVPSPTHSPPPVSGEEHAPGSLPSSGSEILDTRPELGDVDVIKWKDDSEIRKFRLINLIIGKCYDISNQFKIPKAQYDSWMKKRQEEQRKVCHDMLEHWLNSGTGPYSITWRGLIEVLEDVELGEVAKQLKTALLNKIQE